MNRLKKQKFTPLNITVAILIILMASMFIYHRKEKNDGIQKLVDEIELEINGSSRTLTRNEFLGLQKDIAILRKEVFAFEDSALSSTIQLLSSVAIIGGFVFTWRSQKEERDKNRHDIKVANESLVSERFFSAVDLLPKEECSSRLSGIYTLESIAKNIADDPGDYRRRTIKILIAFIKDRSSLTAKELGKEIPSTGLDVKVALEVIHYLWEELLKSLPSEWILDLNCIHLKDFKFTSQLKCWKRLMLEKSYLENIDFVKSDLTESRFSQGILTNAKFVSAILTKSSFKEAKLKNVAFQAATLKQVNFAGATLGDVTFKDTDLENADFTNAILENVDFTDAKNLKKTIGLDQYFELIKLKAI